MDAKVKAARLHRFAECGAQCQVEWSETLKKHRTRGQFCHDRHCEPCQRSRAARIRQNLQKHLTEQSNCSTRFITLTLKHNDQPLKKQIKRLYDAWKKLRKTTLWNDSQSGGCFMLEVKLEKCDDQKTRPRWHPHLHVISQGEWISQSDLRAAWYEITGDSFVVDVRFVKAEKDIAGYVTKYITKGTEAAVWWRDDTAAEWIDASRGVRQCATFGNWRGFRLTAPLDDPGDWVFVDTLTNMVRRSRSGEQIAFDQLMSLRPPGDDAADSLTIQ